MTPPAPSLDEADRLAALHRLGVLDTPAEERFDRLTRLARRLLDVPIALVSLVDADRQWFKSAMGLQAAETPRSVSFCGHAIHGDEIFNVPDARADPRFVDNPLVTGDPNIRFYAGCPLTVEGGHRIGTLCVIDRRPRALGEEDLALLRDLARMAEQELSAVQMASLDELTRLSNRRGFSALAQRAIEYCRRVGVPATLLFFDLDRFKSINDRLGHAEGDRALVDFGQLLRASFREADVIGRLGGDEFVVLMSDATPQDSAVALQRLAAAAGQHAAQAQRAYEIGYSVGVVGWDARHATLEAMLAEADARMYEIKRARLAVAD